MPVPIRDDGSVGPTRRHVVFVHGFSSNPSSCWGEMLRQLHDDVSVSKLFHFEVFQYDTSIMRLSKLRRIPRIREIGEELGRFLESCLVDENGHDRYIDTTLVGHSMGGLVIQSYLVGRLSCEAGRDFDRIRQVIQFASPNFGSDKFAFLRRLLAPLFPNPQEEALRAFSEELGQIHHNVREKIIDAHSRATHSYPLPVYCFWGDSDDIVPEWSAKGYFPHGEPLKGDHSTLKNPDDREDHRYQAFVEVLRHPPGHKHIWEVDSFRYAVRVAHLQPGSVRVARHGKKERTVETDNVATVVRQVRFGRNNRCHDPFPLRYATRNDGWIDAELPPDHVTSPEKLRRFYEGGTEIEADIIPQAGRTSTLQMRVFRGFEQGHRDYHMHVGKKGYFRKLEFEVDLTDYVVAGWRVSLGPHLYFHGDDPGDHRLCLNRDMLDPDPPHEYNPSGIWRWTLEYVKEGVIDIVWDVTQPGSRVERESPSAIELKPGEHAIFGYGSLLSLDSLQRTLGRPYVGPFVVCDLIGWYRTWDVCMPNSTYAFLDESDTWVTPKSILYLNVRRAPIRRMKGVLFVVRDEDLRAFDKREWIYQRVQINEQLRGVTVLKGSAWTYVGRPENLLTGSQDRRHVAVRRTYLDILNAGIQELGPEFLADYQSSTDPVPADLVVSDHKLDRPVTGAP